MELPIALGFGPATGPTLKTALCHIRTLVGRRINTATLIQQPATPRVTSVDNYFFDGIDHTQNTSLWKMKLTGFLEKVVTENLNNRQINKYTK